MKLREGVMKLDRDSFLFPSYSKVIVTMMLFLVFGFVVWPLVISRILFDFYPLGFPLPVYATGYCPPDYVCIEFSWMRLVIDICFWYLVTSAIIKLVMKIRKTRNPNIPM